MKLFTCLFIAFLYSNSFSQVTFYHPDYTPCTHMKGYKNIIGDYCLVHNIDMDSLYCPSDARDMQRNCVYFVLFTNKPAFGIMFNGDADEMKDIVHGFNLESYFFSKAFELQLANGIKFRNKYFTVSWFVDHLGQPSEKYIPSDEVKHNTLVYNNYNIVLYFNEGILSGFRQKEIMKWL